MKDNENEKEEMKEVHVRGICTPVAFDPKDRERVVLITCENPHDMGDFMKILSSKGLSFHGPLTAEIHFPHAEAEAERFDKVMRELKANGAEGITEINPVTGKN